MLGYDNYATRFESIMSPMGFVNANYNAAGYPYGGYGAGYARRYPMPGMVVDPLMNQRTVEGVIAKRRSTQKQLLRTSHSKTY